MDEWKRDYLRNLIHFSPVDLFSFEKRNSWKWSCNIVFEEIWQNVASILRTVSVPRQKLICVVGSYGKTTSVRAIRSVTSLSLPIWTKHNLNCFADVYTSFVRQIFQSLAVVEVGIGSPGQMQLYGEALRPDIVVFTSIGSSLGAEHVKNFKDRNHLLEEKANIIKVIRPHGTLVINGDYPELRRIASKSNVPVITFGFDPSNDIRAVNVQLSASKSCFTTIIGSEQYTVQTALLGQSGIHAVLSSLAVAKCMNVPIDGALIKIRKLNATPGRLQPLNSTCGALLFRDDYKGTVDTIFSACNYFSAIEGERKIAVIGSMDDMPVSDLPFYIEVGSRLAEVFDVGLVVGSEYDKYLTGWRNVTKSRPLLHAASVQDGISQLQEVISENDLVLFAGDMYDRIGRIALALQGRKVTCNRVSCNMYSVLCDDCPYLEM